MGIGQFQKNKEEKAKKRRERNKAKNPPKQKAQQNKTNRRMFSTNLENRASKRYWGMEQEERGGWKSLFSRKAVELWSLSIQRPETNG